MPTTSHHLIIQPAVEAGDAAVLRLTGDVDLKTAPHLRDRIIEAAETHEKVVIDLEAVQFIDSPGLGILLHCHRRLADRGTALVLRYPRREVATMLDIARASTYLTVEDM
jgi:anti-anti-sigma factor